jgi:hypothetical protein
MRNNRKVHSTRGGYSWSTAGRATDDRGTWRLVGHCSQTRAHGPYCLGSLGAVKRNYIVAFSYVNQFCIGLLYGREGLLNTETGGFRPGQCRHTRLGTEATPEPDSRSGDWCHHAFNRRRGFHKTLSPGGDESGWMVRWLPLGKWRDPHRAAGVDHWRCNNLINHTAIRAVLQYYSSFTPPPRRHRAQPH